MKIPVEWLKEYIEVNKPSKELAESFTSLGLMLDKPVTEFKNAGYSTDVLDLEHRMDRSDWLSILGCARDLAAFENAKLIQPKAYEKKGEKLSKDDIVKIEVQCPDLVKRFNTRVFKNIKVKASPDWLKNRLEAYGLPTINNIVDITNYVMVELGQPLHAQDISKMEKREIIIRRARKGEKIITLLGQTVELDENIFVLTQNDKPTVIGGIVGGQATGIDTNTTDIVLDAGNYNQTNIRKTSRRLKIQNETVLRDDKFLHPELTEVAIKRATKLILDLAGGEYYENVDWYPKKEEPKSIILTTERIFAIGGLNLKPEFIKNILNKLEYRILQESTNSYKLEVPYFRTDVEVEDDVVSDLLRMYDYSKIPMQDINAAAPKDITQKIYIYEDKIRDVCVSLGLHEHITDPLVSSSDQPQQVKLENAQSQIKNALRLSMYNGLLNVAENYAKQKVSEIKLFEIGKVYSRNGSTKTLKDFEETRITQVYIAPDNKNHLETSIETRNILDALLTNLGIDEYAFGKNELNKTFFINAGKDLNHIIGEVTWDSFYLLNEALMLFYKIPSRVETGFISKWNNDISILVPSKINLGEIQTQVKKLDEKISYVEIIPQEYNEEGYKSVLLRVTHSADDFAYIREKIVSTLIKDFSVTIR